MIEQNVFVFDASIRDNITMFRGFPTADVDRAIALSGLSRLIEQHSADYLCGENGTFEDLMEQKGYFYALYTVAQ